MCDSLIRAINMVVTVMDDGYNFFSSWCSKNAQIRQITGTSVLRLQYIFHENYVEKRRNDTFPDTLAQDARGIEIEKGNSLMINIKYSRSCLLTFYEL